MRMSDETSRSLRRRRGSTVVHGMRTVGRTSRRVSVGSSLRLRRRRAVGIVGGLLRSTTFVERRVSSSSSSIVVRRVPRSSRSRSRNSFSSSLSFVVVVIDRLRAHRESPRVLVSFPSSIVLVLLILTPFFLLIFFFLVSLLLLLLLIVLILLVTSHRLVVLVGVLLLILLMLVVQMRISMESSVGRRDVVASEEVGWKVQDSRIRSRMVSLSFGSPCSSRLLLLRDSRSGRFSSSSESCSLCESRRRSFERSFSSIRSFVSLDVLSKVIASTETLPTSTASVRLLHRVSSNVSLEMFESFEELSAREERAGERSTSSRFGGRDGLDSMSDDGSLDRRLRTRRRRRGLRSGGSSS